jgi:hypothetical protein
MCLQLGRVSKQPLRRCVLASKHVSFEHVCIESRAVRLLSQRGRGNG